MSVASRSRGSYVPRAAYASQEDPAKGGRGGLLGLGFGPDVGLGGITALKELGEGLTGLGRMAYDMLPDQLPGQTQGAPGNLSTLGTVGKALTGSVAGTADTLNPLVAGAHGVDRVFGTDLADTVGIGGRLSREVLGEEFEGKDFFEKAGERGILPALVEDVGNVALVGGLATAPVKGAAKASSALGAKNTAARLEAVHRGLINKPLIRAAQHPYITAGQHLRSKVLKPAAALDDAAMGLSSNTVAASHLAEYMESRGLEQQIINPGLRADAKVGPRVAEAYADMDAFDPDAVGDWDELADDIDDQYRFLTEEKGVEFEFVDEAEPYAATTPEGLEEMFNDIENGRMKVAKTQEGAHPVWSPEQNDKFRAVHDYFGHAVQRNDVSRHGEEMAWAVHGQTVRSPGARSALTTETRGQNSALNFDPENVARKNRGEEAEFAEQKVGHLPEEFTSRDDAYLDPAKVEKAKTSRVNKALAGAERRLQTRETVRLSREKNRILEAARKKAERNPAVRAAIVAARDLIEETGIHRKQASNIVGAEMEARTSAVQAIIEEYAGKVDDDTIRRIIHRGDGLPTKGISAEARVRIETAITTAVEEQLRVADATRAELIASRKGRVGLEGLADDAAMDPVPTPKQRQRINAARKRLDQAAALQESVIKGRDNIMRKQAAVGDRIARIANKIGEVDVSTLDELKKFDQARSLAPTVWKTAGGVERTAQELFDLTHSQGGGTFKPHERRFLEGGKDSGYMVGVLPGTAAKVPLEQLTPDHIAGVINAFQELYSNREVTIGTWVDENGIVHIDPSEHVAGYDDAVIKASVRQQEAIFDLAKSDDPSIPLRFRPDIAEHFLQPGNRRSYEKFSRQLRDVADHAGWTDTEVLLEGAHQMSRAVAAYDKGLVKHPDDYFKMFDLKPAKNASTSEHALNQLMLDVDFSQEGMAAVVQDAIAKSKDLKTELDWYYRSHDLVNKLTKGVPDIPLWDGTKIPAAELAFQFLAITSVQAEPMNNLAFTLKALSYVTSPEGKKAASKYATLVKRLGNKDISFDDVIREITGGQDGTGLGGKVTKNPRVANTEMPLVGQVITSEAMLRTVMSGYTMDKWTPEFIRDHFTPAFGAKDKGYDFDQALKWTEENEPGFNAKLVGEADSRDMAIREFFGGGTYAKILSFWDNLRDPANSMAVTNDQWMARFAGVHDFQPGSSKVPFTEMTKGGKPGPLGLWTHVAERIRELARIGTEKLGYEIKPHQMQALLWSYTNSELARIRRNHFANYAEEARPLVEAGFADDVDPILEWIDEAAAPYLADGPSDVRPVEFPVRQDDGTVKTERVKVDRGQNKAEFFEKRRASWLKKREEINALIETGDPKKIEKAHKEFEAWRQSTYKALDDEVASGDFLHVWNNEGLPDGKTYHGKRMNEAGAAWAELGGDVLGESFFQKFEDHVLGQFVPKGDDTKHAIRIFRSGNFATLTHENGHLLRQLLTEGEMKTAERHYGVKNGKWTVAAEEAFANDYMQFMTRNKAPRHLEGTFAAIRTALADIWEGIKGAISGKAIPKEMVDIFDSWLDPEVRPLSTPEGEIAGLHIPAAETGTIAQRTATPVKLQKGRPTSEHYHAGRKSAASKARLENLAKRRDVLEQAKETYQKTYDEMQEVLDSGKTMYELRQQRYIDQAQRKLTKVREELGRPSMKNTPTRWQPLLQAFRELEKAAEADPALAAALGTLPETLGEIQALALERGFNPAHVRQFTPAQVRRLVFGNLTIGLGREINEMTAGTRKTRTGAARAAGSVEDSIEAFLAASVEATLERRTNEVVTHVEKNLGRRLPPGAEIPKGWEAWSPTRNFLLTGERISDETGKAVQVASDHGEVIVPKSVVRALRREAGDFDHWAWNSVSKITSPWRTLVLTLSPGWYARNLVGNIIMAEAQGVSLRDWKKAWDSYKNTDEVGRYADIPFVQGDTLATEAGALADNSLIPKPGAENLLPSRAGVRTAVQEGGKIKGPLGYARDSLMRVNAVVDEFSRAAVYHQGRRLNMTEEQAWKAASEALVDYNNLSPFERKAVRSAIPFYSWQKGILKVTAKQAVDHPARAAVLMQLGAMQEEYVADLFGVDGQDVPDYYRHMVGKKNVRSWNPFADTSEILSPEGIARSLNPFLEVAVRKGLGAPEFFPDSYRMGTFGTAEPDVDVPSELTNLLGSSPVGRAAAGGGGGVLSMGLQDQDIDKLRSRILRARKQVRGIPNPETQAS